MISTVLGVITASEPSWIAPFTGLSPRVFGSLVTALRREGAESQGQGRPWKLSLEDRVLLVTAYWRTNLTMRQLALLFGVSKSTVDRVVDDLGPRFALRPRRRFAKDAVLIVDGTLVTPGTTAWPSGQKTIAIPPTIRWASTPTPAWSQWSVGHCPATQRLQGVGTVRSRGSRRPHHRDRRWGLSGHRPGHPAPPRARAERTASLEGRPQRFSPPRSRRCRAHLRPHEDLEDPPRLSPERRRRPPRHARHRPPSQPCPDRIADLCLQDRVCDRVWDLSAHCWRGGKSG